MLDNNDSQQNKIPSDSPVEVVYNQNTPTITGLEENRVATVFSQLSDDEKMVIARFLENIQQDTQTTPPTPPAGAEFGVHVGKLQPVAAKSTYTDLPLYEVEVTAPLPVHMILIQELDYTNARLVEPHPDAQFWLSKTEHWQPSTASEYILSEEASSMITLAEQFVARERVRLLSMLKEDSTLRSHLHGGMRLINSPLGVAYSGTKAEWELAYALKNTLMIYASRRSTIADLKYWGNEILDDLGLNNEAVKAVINGLLATIEDVIGGLKYYDRESS